MSRPTTILFSRHLLRTTQYTLPKRFSTSPRHLSSPFVSGPAPPRLPKKEQEEFERLQAKSTGAFSTPKDEGMEEARENIRMRINQSPDSTPNIRMQINQSPDSNPSTPAATAESGDKGDVKTRAIREGEEFHPNMRRGAPPEFEGEVNPKTGEVGGPKNEPLRWGARADWSYNGRVTDF